MENAIDEAQQSKARYYFLSTLFAQEASVEMLDGMQALKDEGDEFLAGYVIDGWPSSPMDASSADAEEIASQKEMIRRDLAADFSQLFLGMSSRPVAPYESVYTNPDELLMQQARDEVLALYRQSGLEVDEGFTLPEDHVSIELSYMAFLVEKETEALEQEDLETAKHLQDQQQSFITEHLGAWVFDMCDDVIERARTAFYRSHAETMKKFLESEKALDAPEDEADLRDWKAAKKEFDENPVVHGNDEIMQEFGLR